MSDCDSDGSIDFSDDCTDDACMEYFDEFVSHEDTIHEDIVQEEPSKPLEPGVSEKQAKKKHSTFFQITSNVGQYLGDLPANMKTEYNNKLANELLKNEQKLELVEGVTMCFKCKSKKVYTYQMQTRSGDEAMTTFYVCSVCASKWKS